MLKMNKNIWANLGLASLLVGIIVLGRYFITDIPNFAPVAAVGIFAGFMFRSKWMGLIVPLIGMLLTDYLFAGFYDMKVLALVYIGLAIPAMAGPWLAKSLQENNATGAMKKLLPFLKVGGVSVGASLFFFFISNFGVWMFSGMYAKTVTGFTLCYASALPFFKYTFAGDMVYCIVLFGTLACTGKLLTLNEDKLEAQPIRVRNR